MWNAKDTFVSFCIVYQPSPPRCPWSLNDRLDSTRENHYFVNSATNANCKHLTLFY